MNLKQFLNTVGCSEEEIFDLNCYTTEVILDYVNKNGYWNSMTDILIRLFLLNVLNMICILIGHLGILLEC